MNLSIIIPAYNEAETIAEVISKAKNACQESAVDFYEIIVADDDSTDKTAILAKTAGAIVVKSGKRNIGATRNVGADAAKCDYLIFLDADTYIHAKLIQSTIKAFERGKIGGGALLTWSEPAPFWSHCALNFWNTISFLFTFPAGSYLFVKKEAFQQVNGFDEEYYASEELHFARKLKKIGKLVVLRQRYSTSPRKVHQFSLKEFKTFFIHFLKHPMKTVKNREFLDIWYSRR